MTILRKDVILIIEREVIEMEDKWTLNELIDEAKKQAIFWDTDYHKKVYENLIKLKKILDIIKE